MEVKNHKIILEYRVGSHLYGLNTPKSDEDFAGVFLPLETEVFGFENCETIDISIKNKDNRRKNTKEAVDRKFHEIRKFLKLAMENNPNVLEQLWINKENLIYSNEVGKILLDKKHLFPFKGKGMKKDKIKGGCTQKFLGYAYSQRHKMLIKPQNFTALEKTLKILYTYVGVKSMDNLTDKHQINKSKDYVIEIQEFLEQNNAPIKITEHYIKVGDINIQKNIMIKQAIQHIESRIGKAGYRIDLIKQYGVDSKFAHHTIRLMYEGLDLLKYGELVFPLPKEQHDILMDIKQGNWSAEEVVEYSEELEKEIEDAHTKSKLPEKPRYKEIQNLCMNILKQEFNK